MHVLEDLEKFIRLPLERLAVSRSLGENSPLVSPEGDIYYWTVQSGDVLVLASDGIWDDLSNGEVAKFLASGIEQSAYTLLEEIEMRSKTMYGDGGDNQSIILIEL